MPFRPDPYPMPVTPARISIQGQTASFSHITCTHIFGALNADAFAFYNTFEEPLDDVKNARSDLAVIPIFNTIAGFVPYVPQHIRVRHLHAIGEFFLPIEMCLMGLPGSNVMDIRRVYSHIHALNQCGKYLGRHAYMEKVIHDDTGGSAKRVRDEQKIEQAAIAPAYAAQEYGLKILERGIQDFKKNTTRFLILSREPLEWKHEPAREYVTTMLLKPRRSLERPLNRIMDVFEKHGIYHDTPMDFKTPDMRLDEFYIEAWAHQDTKAMRNAIADLAPRKKGTGITSRLSVTGCFPAHHFQRFARKGLAVS